LADLEQAVTAGANLMPAMVDAVKDGVTLGEISELLREAFGTFRENVTI
jgi:methylmalonyl-CoA mutase N-terminal domain/subunit